MNRTYPCPSCGAVANLATGCSGCHRPPDPAAAEVIALNARYAELAGEVEAARVGYLSGAAQLEELRRHRNALAAQVAARAVSRPVPGPPPDPGPIPADRPAGRPVAPAKPARPETSVRTVQNVLFILGGLLLGSAAVVFTAVAWARFGLVGRAAILGVATALVLAVPPVALARRLSATAETFAALGLLLVLLDGYAAWYVDLAGVATVLTPTTYAGTVCAVTSALAFGYARATRLAGPRFAALVLAQPVLPLLAVRVGFGAAGWAAVFGAVALGDVALGWRRHPYGLGIAAAGLDGLAGILAGGLALAADAGAGTLPAALRAGTVRPRPPHRGGGPDALTPGPTRTSAQSRVRLPRRISRASCSISQGPCASGRSYPRSRPCQPRLTRTATTRGSPSGSGSTITSTTRPM